LCVATTFPPLRTGEKVFNAAGLLAIPSLRHFIFNEKSATG